ncbi:MAG: peroxiredoxin [Neisseriaceae bacterium]|nr:peroxiredoxin [Neisseriaceae bacterium]
MINALPSGIFKATQDRELDFQSINQPVVIYFYPKDNTPGCTIEAQEFAALFEAFCALGVSVFGVSRDSLKSHANFRAKFELPFDLISDVDEKLCQHFEVIQLKKMYGKEVRGIVRTTLLISSKGEVLQRWDSVKSAGHAANVLVAVRAHLMS